MPGSVDAVRFGIQTLAPKLLGSKPDFVISGSNVGSETTVRDKLPPLPTKSIVPANLGPGITGSGTVYVCSITGDL